MYCCRSVECMLSIYVYLLLYFLFHFSNFLFCVFVECAQLFLVLLLLYSRIFLFLLLFFFFIFWGGGQAVSLNVYFYVDIVTQLKPVQCIVHIKCGITMWHAIHTHAWYLHVETINETITYHWIRFADTDIRTRRKKTKNSIQFNIQLETSTQTLISIRICFGLVFFFF